MTGVETRVAISQRELQLYSIESELIAPFPHPARLNMLRSVSAGGLDLLGSKGTSMDAQQCNHTRPIPDGRDLFQADPWSCSKAQLCILGGKSLGQADGALDEV